MLTRLVTMRFPIILGVNYYSRLPICTVHSNSEFLGPPTGLQALYRHGSDASAGQLPTIPSTTLTAPPALDLSTAIVDEMLPVGEDSLGSVALDDDMLIHVIAASAENPDEISELTEEVAHRVFANCQSYGR
jgi:hypothetical protein